MRSIGNFTRDTIRRFKAIMAAVLVSFAVGFMPFESAARPLNTGTRDARRVGPLTAVEAKAFVRKLETETAIVLYDVINLPGVKAERDRLNRRFKRRGSMAGKTRTQIANLYIKDVKASISETEIEQQIVEAVARLKKG